jgi:uncharacterized membrane protein
MKKLLKFFISGLLFLVPIFIFIWFLKLILDTVNLYSEKLILLINIKSNFLTKTGIIFFIVVLAGITSKYISKFTTEKFRKYLGKKLGDTRGKIVLIEPTRRGFIEVGIVTKELNSNYVVVFVPTFPSVFTGSVRIVEKNKVKFVDMTQQELINFILTAGIIIPQNFSQKLTQKDESGDK